MGCVNEDCLGVISLKNGKRSDSGDSIQCEQCEAWHCVFCMNEAHPNDKCQKRPRTSGNLQYKLWVFFNTKTCPNCKVPIKKNHGCKHMTCKNCGANFCWKCKGYMYSSVYMGTKCYCKKIRKALLGTGIVAGVVLLLPFVLIGA